MAGYRARIRIILALTLSFVSCMSTNTGRSTVDGPNGPVHYTARPGRFVLEMDWKAEEGTAVPLGDIPCSFADIYSLECLHVVVLKEIQFDKGYFPTTPAARINFMYAGPEDPERRIRVTFTAFDERKKSLLQQTQLTKDERITARESVWQSGPVQYATDPDYFVDFPLNEEQFQSIAKVRAEFVEVR